MQRPCRRGRLWAGWKQHQQEARTRRLFFEQLEPRQMLTAVTFLPADNPAPGSITQVQVEAALATLSSTGTDLVIVQQQVSETILRNVRVLAIGQTLETTGEEKVVSGATATLELTPGQTEILSLAQSMGQLSLSLRSLADTPKPGETVDIREQKNGSVKMLKYGVPSQVFGVN